MLCFYFALSLVIEYVSDVWYLKLRCQGCGNNAELFDSTSTTNYRVIELIFGKMDITKNGKLLQPFFTILLGSSLAFNISLLIL